MSEIDTSTEAVEAMGPHGRWVHNYCCALCGIMAIASLAMFVCRGSLVYLIPFGLYTAGVIAGASRSLAEKEPQK